MSFKYNRGRAKGLLLHWIAAAMGLLLQWIAAHTAGPVGSRRVTNSESHHECIARRAAACPPDRRIAESGRRGGGGHRARGALVRRRPGPGLAGHAGTGHGGGAPVRRETALR